MKYLMNFSYDGSSFNGYQKQKDKITIQGNIESVLEKRFNKNISIYSSGRTDKGVHALNQYAHFEINEKIDLNKLKKYLNDYLDDGVHIKNIEEVNENFNARFDVKSKTYMYLVNTKEYSVIKRNYALQYNKEIDINKLNEIKDLFIGTHNFENFTTVQDKKESYERTVFDITISQKEENVVIYITGSGFLRYMVRNIIGCFIEYNEGLLTKKDIIDMLNRKTTRKPVKVNACGLYLFDVTY